MSVHWQSGKFLDKAVDIVPVTKLKLMVFQEVKVFVWRKGVLMPTILHDDGGEEEGSCLVTWLWRTPPVITIVSSSGIPQAPNPLCRNAKVPPPATKRI